MIIQTERLILRDFVESDWRDVLAYQNDPLYLRYYSWNERTEKDVRNFVQIFLDQQKQLPRYKFQLAIILPEEKKVIGNCGIRKDKADAKQADMGYELGSRYWGQAYASEAARAMLAFAFNELKLHRVYAHCIAENTGSARVLEKLGMRREGHFRESEWMKGRWWDTLHYAILDYEWQALNNLEHR